MLENKMINLTSLVIQYKQNKDKLILDKIYKELKSTVKQKTKFLFYHKWYPMNLYNKCKFCINCEELNNIPKSEHNLICKECNKCKCIKGTFNLYKNGLCEYDDVKDDIWLEILRTIDNFDITKDFNTYLFSNLWVFVPTFLTNNFIKSLLDKSLTITTINKDDEEGKIEIDELGEESDVDKFNKEQDKEDKNKDLVDLLLLKCSKREKEVLNLFLKDKTMTQEKAGAILNISHQSISLILKKLKKYYKIILAKQQN